MSTPIERYRKLGFAESLPIIYKYPVACEELSFILRSAYAKVPKNLQALIFQDMLAAFRLFSEMQTSSAKAAAYLLLRSAETALPKQKRNLAITEFKHAKVAQKRCCKSRQEEIGNKQLPQDVLVHIFSFLDLRSLVSAGPVCWSWNLAAGDNHLWRLQYDIFFASYPNCSRLKVSPDGRLSEENTVLREDNITRAGVDWREEFKRAYIGSSSKRLRCERGYCGQCNAVVWVNSLKCPSRHCRVKPIEPCEVVKYILDDSVSAEMSSSSDSDSESDEGSISRLWVYPRHISRFNKKPISN